MPKNVSLDGRMLPLVDRFSHQSIVHSLQITDHFIQMMLSITSATTSDFEIYNYSLIRSRITVLDKSIRVSAVGL